MADYIHHLFRRFVKGKCSKQEFEELMSLLEDHSNEAVFRQMLEEVYRRTEVSVKAATLAAKDQDTAEKASPSVVQMPNRQGAGRRIWKVAVAASVLLAVSVAGWKWLQPRYSHAGSHQTAAIQRVPENELQQHTLRAEQKHIVLPDGTEVWLNAESSLQFPKKFDADKREVYLTGEAFFDVKHAEKIPFLIHTANDMVTRVLGTAFDIKAYANQKMSVSVKRGLVEVSKNRKVLGTLRMGQQIQVDEKPHIEPVIQQVKKDNIATWTEGKLNFDAMTFREITEDLERTFNVQIILENAQTGNEKITCTFNRNDGLQKILETLCTLTSTNFTHKQNTYNIN